MSFAVLATELDTRIISFLDQSSLSKMSRVSRYYRRIAVPHLYKHIRFVNYNWVAIKWLSLVLAFQPALAMHIKSFTLDSSS